MKKAEIIKLLRERVSEKYPQPVVKRAIADVINEFCFILKEELGKVEELKIAGFGTFRIKEIPKEETKETKRVIRFIPSKK